MPVSSVCLFALHLQCFLQETDASHRVGRGASADDRCTCVLCHQMALQAHAAVSLPLLLSPKGSAKEQKNQVLVYSISERKRSKKNLF